MFDIYLRDRNHDLVGWWKRVFYGEPAVHVSDGDIFKGAIRTDAIVSPANSFGVMDGGIDAAYLHRWPKLQHALQVRLAGGLLLGELPVGNAEIVPILDWESNRVDEDDCDYKWLISAPTMRVPMDISGTVNAYLAFRAALIAVLWHNGSHGVDKQISSITCPGLGTAIGGMPPEVAAVQMRAAYLCVMRHPFVAGNRLTKAIRQHECLVRGLPNI